MPDMAAIADTVSKFGELAKVVYEDLAQPGVRQVGTALATVGDTFNTVLYPLALLNGKREALLRSNLEKFRARMQREAVENITQAPPEIAIPVVEKFMITQSDEIVSLYVELLASASVKSESSKAHPSFVNIISNLNSDEALILERFRFQQDIARFVTIERQGNDPDSPTIFISWFNGESEELNLAFPMNIWAYLTNLNSLGLTFDRTVNPDEEPILWKKADHALRNVKWTTRKLNQAGLQSGTIEYDQVSPLGLLFLSATSKN